MLPEWKALRKTSRKIKIPKEPYFELADEYVELKAKFVCDGVLDSLYLWFDMLIYPLYVFIRLCMLDFSPMYIFALVKTYQLWIDWLRLRVLQEKVDSWMEIVRSVGGPWISANNPDFHAFVYADGMERIAYSALWRPKKLAKGTK
jgi:hypothetical protein